MNASRLGRLDCFTGAANIVLVRTRQGTNRRILDGLGDRKDGIKITGGGCGKPRFNHINAHLFELPGNPDFLFLGHGSTRALLTVA